MTTTLSKTETTILLDPAGRDDAAIIVPKHLKPVTHDRILGKLAAQKRIREGQDGEPLTFSLLQVSGRSVSGHLDARAVREPGLGAASRRSFSISCGETKARA